jgi:hypothetical protein
MVFFLYTSLSAQPQRYATYLNARFGYSIRYPVSLQPQPEAENGDGRVFLSADGKTTLTVWGRLPVSPAGDLEQAMTYAKENRRVNYRIKRPTWFVLSGFTNDSKVFYSKTVLVSDRTGTYLKTFEFVYPISQKAQWDSIVTRVEQSFH